MDDPGPLSGITGEYIISLLCIPIQGIHLEGTIIYADIGPATARPSASISLDLDDSHVEYSRLNLKMMEQQLSKSQTLDAKSETEIKFDGRSN